MHVKDMHLKDRNAIKTDHRPLTQRRFSTHSPTHTHNHHTPHPPPPHFSPRRNRTYVNTSHSQQHILASSTEADLKPLPTHLEARPQSNALPPSPLRPTHLEAHLQPHRSCSEMSHPSNSEQDTNANDPQTMECHLQVNNRTGSWTTTTPSCNTAAALPLDRRASPKPPGQTPFVDPHPAPGHHPPSVGRRQRLWTPADPWQKQQQRFDQKTKWLKFRDLKDPNCA